MLAFFSSLFSLLQLIFKELGEDKLRQAGRNEVIIEVKNEQDRIKDSIDNSVSNAGKLSDDEITSP